MIKRSMMKSSTLFHVFERIAPPEVAFGLYLTGTFQESGL